MSDLKIGENAPWQKKMCGRELVEVIRDMFLIDPEGNITHISLKVRSAGHLDNVI
jgi:peroxiredoxin